MTLIFRLIGFGLTGLLTAYVLFSQRRRGWGKACVMGMGFFVAGVYVDGIFALVMEGVAGENFGPLLQGLEMLVSKSVLAAALMMGRVVFGTKRENEEDKPSGKLVYLDGVTLGIHSFFLLLLLAVLGTKGRYGSSYAELFALLFCLAALLFYDASLYLHGRKQQERERLSQDAARKSEANLYLKGVEDNYQRTRELWHDLKNHINLMNLLLQEKKYGELGDYLRIFGEDVDSLTLPVKSGNIIVDALLADKLGKAKRENIEVKLSLCNLTGLRLKPDEICGLLGNLLDNALEGNYQVVEGRFLEVDCRELEDCYYIRVRNAAAWSARVRDGIPESGKSDRRNQVGHGLGLRSVERIVHGCGGEMTVEGKEGSFTAVARLPK